MKTLQKIQDKLKKRFGYEFEKGDEARLKSTGDEGIILDRSFPFDKFTLGLLPGKYYSFQIQEKGHYPNGSTYTLNCAKIGCKQIHLERIM